jgi:hypothetical protein
MTKSLYLAIVMFTVARTLMSEDLYDQSDTMKFNRSGSPYYIEKDIVVPQGKILTIPKGCVLLFNPFSGIVVQGTLKVQGTQDTPVVFTSVNDSLYNKNALRLPAPFDWNGIHISKESRGSQLDHFILSYSVYGLKAQSVEVSLNGGIFRSNGQFHFTLNEKIQDVKDNIPFSFGNFSEGTPNRPEAATNVTSSPQGNQPFTARMLIKSKPFYYSSLSLGIVGAGLGVFFAVKANHHQSALEEISSGAAAPDKGRWNSERNAKWNSITGSSISFILGAIGAAGFGVSLAF